MSHKYNISLVTGDGIGPEISESAFSILQTINDNMGIKFEIKKLEAGDTVLKNTGKALPDETFEAIKNSDACLKAPVGESAKDVIVYLRRMLDLYANIRPAISYPNMPSLRDDVDLVIVRENTEDLYTGEEFEIGEGISGKKDALSEYNTLASYCHLYFDSAKYATKLVSKRV